MTNIIYHNNGTILKKGNIIYNYIFLSMQRAIFVINQIKCLNPLRYHHILPICLFENICHHIFTSFLNLNLCSIIYFYYNA